MSIFNYICNSTEDFKGCFLKSHLAFMLGWQDIKQRYRRSKLGPFWITISMGVMIAMIGVVFGQVMNNPMHEYLPFLATGIIFWTFISSSVMEGVSSFIDGQGMIRQLNLPLSLYLVRSLWRNIVILGHNLIILPIVMIFVGKGISWSLLCIMPAFILLTVNIFCISLFLSVFCTRFRDMPQIVSSFLQILFYLTPVIWMPGALGPRTKMLLLDPNPAYHLLELVRAPIMGYYPTITNWVVVFVLTIISLLISSIFFGKYRVRIPYWL